MAIKHTDGSVTHEGLVLEVFVRDERIMSDVWATCRYARVWSLDKPEEIYLSGSDPCLNHKGEAEVDATPAARAAYEAYLAELDRVARLRKLEAEARHLEPGKRVRVVRGRKVPHGTEGVAFWVGDTKYGKRVGFTSDAGETLWTAASNVDVVPVCPLCAEE